MSQWSFFQSTLIIALLSPLGLFLAASFFLLVIPAGEWPPKRRLRLGLLTLLFAFSCTDFCGKKQGGNVAAARPSCLCSAAARSPKGRRISLPFLRSGVCGKQEKSYRVAETGSSCFRASSRR